MSRLEANMVLTEILMELVEDFPDMRFGQLLRNFGFIEELRNVVEEHEFKKNDWKNEFHLESEDLLDRVEAKIDEFFNGKSDEKEDNH